MTAEATAGAPAEATTELSPGTTPGATVDGAPAGATGLTGIVGPVLAMAGHLRGQGPLFAAVAVTIWLGIALAVVATVLSVATASALAVDAVAPSGAGAPTGLLAGLCAAVVGLGVVSWLEQWFSHVLAYRVIDVIRLKVHRAIARIAPLGLAHRRSGDTVAAAMADVESMEWFYAHTAAQVVAGLTACLVLSAAAVAWLGPLALAVPAAQAVVITVPLVLLPLATRQGARLRAALTGLSSEALAARSCARETVLLGRLKEVAGKVARSTVEVQAARRALAVRTAVEQALIEATSVVLVLGAVLLAGRAAADSRIGAGLVPVVVALAGTALSPALAVTGALGRLGETSGAARRVDALIAVPGYRPAAPAGTAGRRGAAGAGAGADADAATGGAGSVRVTGLRVRYPGGSAPVLDGLDLEVPDGRSCAVVGASGEGKTTLALALARLVAQEEGRILVGGIDTAAEAPERTRERLVLVCQHTHVFRATVRDNLLTPDADEDETWTALERARLADRVRALPEGLDEVLAERGAAWSGGERQRLGLARGLLRDPDVLVLDEPTAGLDTCTEAEFLDALLTSRKGRTTIIITHRVAVMSSCDRVALLRAGRVDAVGPHDVLRRTSPVYRAVLDAAEPAPEVTVPESEPAPEAAAEPAPGTSVPGSSADDYQERR
ncbi:amino acid ABC transporter ATP-binding/permease protein [Actinomyces gerencseriae]|uniref:amino acid ABC transporter ATP-binding/permease protein n=2 Tax=Actinomyces gerencseriae TaxID=52769 RepID=UPI00040D8290|nr:ABC transporter ATP-binding protein [Actinomyces gerencseriae]